MRKQDLKVGEDYAIGSTSRYDRFRAAHGRIVEVEGTRPNGRGGVKRGVVVVLVEDGKDYPFLGPAGKEFVLNSARDVREPWADFAASRAAQDERRHAQEAERARKSTIANEVMRRLSAWDIEQFRTDHDGTFIVPAETMARIVERVA